jgi:hypothetical protein
MWCHLSFEAFSIGFLMLRLVWCVFGFSLCVGVGVLILPQHCLCLIVCFVFAVVFCVCLVVGELFFFTSDTWGYVGFGWLWLWVHVAFGFLFYKSSKVSVNSTMQIGHYYSPF